VPPSVCLSVRSRAEGIFKFSKVSTLAYLLNKVNMGGGGAGKKRICAEGGRNQRYALLGLILRICASSLNFSLRICALGGRK
jgi:hypothetical protein